MQRIEASAKIAMPATSMRRRPKWSPAAPPSSSSADSGSMTPAYLRLIVLIEARAAPRLRAVDGLWRKPVKGQGSAEARPGSMTALIRAEGLLPRREVDRIIATAPAGLIAFQEAAARYAAEERPPLADWLERFHPGAERLAA